MQSPHIFPPVNVQMDLEPFLPFRYAYESFITATRIGKVGVEAAAKFVGGDRWVFVGPWGARVVLVYEVDREGVAYFRKLIDVEAGEFHEVAMGELQWGEPEAKEAPKAAVFFSETFEEGFIVLAFGGEDLGVEDLALLVDAEKDVQVFGVGGFVGSLVMAGLRFGTYVRGVFD